MHEGHVEIVERLLSDRIVDKVLLHAIANGGTRKSTMKSTEVRCDIMEQSLSHLPSKSVQVIRDLSLVQQQENETWIGIIGSDNRVLQNDKLHGVYMVKQQHNDIVEPDVLASSCVTVSEFVVFCRNQDKPTIASIGTRPVRYMAPGAYAHMSSTKVREALQGMSHCGDLRALEAYKV